MYRCRPAERLACENYGSKVIPGINGLYLVNGVYDLRDIHDRSLRGRISIGDALRQHRADRRAQPQAPALLRAWAGTNIRVSSPDADHVDTSVPPTLHGLLVAKAKSTGYEASVRYHTLGHNPRRANQTASTPSSAGTPRSGRPPRPRRRPWPSCPGGPMGLRADIRPFTASQRRSCSQIGSDRGGVTIATPSAAGLLLKGPALAAGRPRSARSTVARLRQRHCRRVGAAETRTLKVKRS